jgi:hypothetical protein
VFLIVQVTCWPELTLTFSDVPAPDAPLSHVTSFA